MNIRYLVPCALISACAGPPGPAGEPGPPGSTVTTTVRTLAVGEPITTDYGRALSPDAILSVSQVTADGAVPLASFNGTANLTLDKSRLLELYPQASVNEGGQILFDGSGTGGTPEKNQDWTIDNFDGHLRIFEPTPSGSESRQRGNVVVMGNLELSNASGGGNLSVMGTLTVAGTKNFVAPHPSDSTLAIHYAALEGGEAGTYWRGTAKLVGGRGKVWLPAHFAWTTEPEGLTVHVTPGADCEGWVAVKRKTLQAIELVEKGATDDCEADIWVQGVRKGYAHYEVLRPRAGSPVASRSP